MYKYEEDVITVSILQVQFFLQSIVVHFQIFINVLPVFFLNNMEYHRLIFMGLIVTAMAQLYPSRAVPSSWFDETEEMSSDQDVDINRRQDQEEAPTNEHHSGRVQIKVYRGPDTHDEHEHFAPYGFWVKQPADNDHHK